MSKAQTDIRTTSYDALAARPHGYQGTIEDVIAQIRAEPDSPRPALTGRTELRHYLGLPPKHLSVSGGPSLEMDESPRYGFDEPPAPPRSSVAYAEARGWLPKLRNRDEIIDRIAGLSPRESVIYKAARLYGQSVRDALATAESYPYPAARS